MVITVCRRSSPLPGGWIELSLPDEQASQLADVAVQGYLAKEGLASSLGCSSGAKPQIAADPTVISGRKQVPCLFLQLPAAH